MVTGGSKPGGPVVTRVGRLGSARPAGWPSHAPPRGPRVGVGSRGGAAVVPSGARAAQGRGVARVVGTVVPRARSRACAPRRGGAFGPTVTARQGVVGGGSGRARGGSDQEARRAGTAFG